MKTDNDSGLIIAGFVFAILIFIFLIVILFLAETLGNGL